MAVREAAVVRVANSVVRVAATGSMTPPARIVPFGHQHEDSIVPMEANWLAMQVG